MKYKSVIVCMFNSKLLKTKIPEDMIEFKDTVISDASFR